MTRARAAMRTRREQGAASLELLVLIPMLFAFALIAFQAGVIAWTVISTSEAAREAARAQSLGGNALNAAENSLPAGLNVASLRHVGPGNGIELRVNAPSISGLPTFTVTRKAVLP